MNGGFVNMDKTSSSSSLKRRKTRRQLDRLLNGRLTARDRRSHSTYELTRNESYSESPLDDSDQRIYLPTNRCHLHMNVLTYTSVLLSLCAFLISGVFLWLFFLTRADLSNFYKQIHADLEHRKELINNLQQTNLAFDEMKTVVHELQNNVTNFTVTVVALRNELVDVNSKLVQMQQSGGQANLPKDLEDLKETTASLGSSLADIKLIVNSKLPDRINLIENNMTLLMQNISFPYFTKLQSLLPLDLLDLVSGFHLSNNFTTKIRRMNSTESSSSSSLSTPSTLPVILMTQDDFISLHNISVNVTHA